MAKGDTYGRYAVKIGTGASAQTYSLRVLDKTYGSTGVGEIIGIRKATDSDNFNGIGSLNDLRRAGLLSKIRVTAKTADGKKITYRLWCVTANIPNAVGKLPTKNIDGNNIVSAGQSLTTRFH
jgi:hypothetical protein